MQNTDEIHRNIVDCLNSTRKISRHRLQEFNFTKNFKRYLCTLNKISFNEDISLSINKKFNIICFFNTDKNCANLPDFYYE